MEDLKSFVDWVRNAEKIVNAEYSKGIKKAGSFDTSAHTLLLQHYFAYKTFNSTRILSLATLLLAVAVIILNVVSIILFLSA